MSNDALSPDELRSVRYRCEDLAKLPPADLIAIAKQIDYSPGHTWAGADHLEYRVLPVLRELTRRVATHQEAKGNDQ